MNRKLYNNLLKWKTSPTRKPLVLRGARQVGKTYLIKSFGQAEFTNILYINFEEMPSVKSFFDGDLNPKKIIQSLSLYFNQEIHPQTTLLFFDEIQECPNALTSLKYFQEQAKEYFIIAAGSLLGVKLAKAKGFPVGKVNFLTLYPCCFFEFLDALGKEKLRAYLEEINFSESIAEPLHLQLVELLRLYYFVGGMPEAVQRYINTEDLNQVRQVQQDILDAYLLDFSKHAPPTDVVKITETWTSIPAQLAKENKKFIYNIVHKNARAREYQDALGWLNDAGLVHRSFNISVPRLPIESYCDKKSFKVFLLDVGLLCALSRLPAKTILFGDKLFTEFKGALTENYVAQELKATLEENLYYWSSQRNAEVDFVVPYEGEVYPLEVKAGTSTKQKSLVIYREKYHPSITVRTSLMNLKKERDFYNLPLYLVGRFPSVSLCPQTSW